MDRRFFDSEWRDCNWIYRRCYSQEVDYETIRESIFKKTTETICDGFEKSFAITLIIGIEGNQIEITVKASEEKDKFAYTHKGIKFPKDKDVSIATIDVTDKYDAEPTISFENGLLKLKFTIKPEEKPKKLSIK